MYSKDTGIAFLLEVEYKDRISRYGFETFCSFCESYGVDVVVIEADEEKEFEQELAEDMISLNRERKPQCL